MILLFPYHKNLIVDETFYMQVHTGDIINYYATVSPLMHMLYSLLIMHELERIRYQLHGYAW